MSQKGSLKKKKKVNILRKREAKRVVAGLRRELAPRRGRAPAAFPQKVARYENCSSSQSGGNGLGLVFWGAQSGRQREKKKGTGGGITTRRRVDVAVFLDFSYRETEKRGETKTRLKKKEVGRDEG